MIAINSALAVDLTGQVAADTLLGPLLLRHRRTGRLRPRRRAQPRRQADHRAAVDRQGRHAQPHPAALRGGRGRRHQPRRRALRGHRVRRRRPVGQEHPRARPGADRDRPPRLPRRAARRGQGSAATCSRIRSCRARPTPGGGARESPARRRSRSLVRPVRMSDEEPLQDLLYRLSDESTYSRFLRLQEASTRTRRCRSSSTSTTSSNMALVATDGRDRDPRAHALRRRPRDRPRRHRLRRARRLARARHRDAAAAAHGRDRRARGLPASTPTCSLEQGDAARLPAQRPQGHDPPRPRHLFPRNPVRPRQARRPRPRAAGFATAPLEARAAVSARAGTHDKVAAAAGSGADSQPEPSSARVQGAITSTRARCIAAARSLAVNLPAR